ncbi:DNA primase [Sporosarcina sp. FSL K6-1540]|uniref:DNA primase n=1 Tax=Sporosarcina sp. FSL K6-1540 TaxID=2921555 RepID=UPI00315AE347
MALKLTGEKKWLKLGAATILSVGMLAACGDSEDDVDVDVNNPVEDVDPNDGTDTNVDVDTDDGTDADVDVDTDDGTDADVDVDTDDGTDTDADSDDGTEG